MPGEPGHPERSEGSGHHSEESSYPQLDSSVAALTRNDSMHPSGMMDTSMGVFAVNIQVGKASGRAAFRQVRGVTVDTGAEMTWIASGPIPAA